MRMCDKCTAMGYGPNAAIRNVCKLIPNFHDVYNDGIYLGDSEEDMRLVRLFQYDSEPWNHDDAWWKDVYFGSKPHLLASIRRRVETLRPR